MEGSRLISSCQARPESPSPLPSLPPSVAPALTALFVCCAMFLGVLVDMWGMATADAVTIVLAFLSDLGDFAATPERLHQGLLNHLLVMKLCRGALASDPVATVNGTATFDPARAYYWGQSQGGILVRSARLPLAAPASATAHAR